MSYNDNWKLDYNGMATSLYNIIQDLDQQQNDLNDAIDKEIRDRSGDEQRLNQEIYRIKNTTGLDDTNGLNGQFKRLDKSTNPSNPTEFWDDYLQFSDKTPAQIKADGRIPNRSLVYSRKNHKLFFYNDGNAQYITI